MLNANGIEVCLRPRFGWTGTAPASYEELELSPQNDNGGRHKRCFIPHVDEDVVVVIKLPRSFDRLRDAVLHVQIGIGANEDVSRVQEWPRPFERSLSGCRKASTYYLDEIPTGSKVIGHFRIGLIKPKAVPESCEEEISRMSLTETLASQRIDIGSVSVFLQLGGVYWLKRGHGAKGLASRASKRYSVNSFFPLANGRGQKMLFEFRPRVGERLAKLEKVATVLEPADSQPAGSVTPHGTGASGQPEGIPKVTRKIRLIAPTKPVAAGATPSQHGASVSRTDKPKKQRKRRTLQVCTCKDEQCRQAARKPRDSTNDASGRRHAPEKPDKPDGSEKPMKPEQMVHSCVGCVGLKKPPRGMKISWRSRTDSWIYVDKRAKDEGPSFEEEPNDDADVPEQVHGRDASSPRPELTPVPEAMRESSTVSQSAEPQPHVEHIVEPRAETRSSRDSSTPEPPRANSGIANSEYSSVVEEQTVDQDSSPPTSAEQQAVQQGSTSGCDTRSTDVQEKARVSAERQAPLGPLRGAARQREENHGHSPSREKSADPSLPGSQRDTRSAATSEIDLTVDEETAPVVKQEARPHRVKRSASVMEENHSQSDLQDRLLDVQFEEEQLKLEERKLQLKRRRVELERRLKKSERTSGTAVEPIEIEDDVKVEA